MIGPSGRDLTMALPKIQLNIKAYDGKSSTTAAITATTTITLFPTAAHGE